MLANCYVIVVFPIYGQFAGSRKPDSGRIVCKTYIVFNSNLTKAENRNKKSLTQLTHYYFK